jgi:hypothetical protein
MQQQRPWERPPALHAFWRAFLAGEWVTRSFAWVSMMISRFAGPMMTMAVSYLMLYAIDTHHDLSTPVAHPSVWDSLATTASDLLNMTAELVFPGTVGLGIRALVRWNWLHTALYALVSVMFAVLTIRLLAAFMTGGLTNGFLSSMLLWRAVSALSSTMVAEVCSHHEEDQCLPPQHRNRIDELAAQGEHLADELSQLSIILQARLQESATELASTIHEQLTAELAALKESLQTDREKPAQSPPVKAHRHRETRSTRPLKRKRAASVQATEKRPVQPAFSGTGSERERTEKQTAFAARAFVFSCLQERPEAKLTEMKSLALAQGHELSLATISRYRKHVLARCESSAPANDESITLKGENSAYS